jgi:hypothetical protein
MKAITEKTEEALKSINIAISTVEDIVGLAKGQVEKGISVMDYVADEDYFGTVLKDLKGVQEDLSDALEGK